MILRSSLASRSLRTVEQILNELQHHHLIRGLSKAEEVHLFVSDYGESSQLSPKRILNESEYKHTLPLPQ